MVQTADASCNKKKIAKKETCGLYYKCFTIVIYDHNDIGLYYKTRDDSN
jgi:hypothetical protein